MTTIFYRPPENHVGVIYRFDRFHRFAAPRGLYTLLPWEYVAKEVKLDMRTAVLKIKDIHTRDSVILDIELKIFFRVDIREAKGDGRLQAIRFESEAAWEEIVKTGVNDIARNDVFIGRTFAQLNSQEGRAILKRTMSEKISERVRGFGIFIDPQFGVNIANIQPNEVFHKAMQENSAAKVLGQAAVERLRPALEQLGQDQEAAMTNLVMQIASAIIKTGQVPETIYTDGNSGNTQNIREQDNIDTRIRPRNPRTPREQFKWPPKSASD